ncbi:MAG: hypothetical protein WBQ22_18165, partial [Bradyrhizobium sp.]
MDDNRPDDAPPPDSGRPKRAPPTIDLEASDVTAPAADAGDPKTAGRFAWLSSIAIPPFAVAAVSGAIAALLVMVVVWAAGWPTEPTRPIAEINTGAIDALS